LPVKALYIYRTEDARSVIKDDRHKYTTAAAYKKACRVCALSILAQ